MATECLQENRNETINLFNQILRTENNISALNGNGSGGCSKGISMKLKKYK